MGLYDFAAGSWKKISSSSFFRKNSKEGGCFYWLIVFSKWMTCKRYSMLAPKDYPQALWQWYKRATGFELDYDNPVRYSDKIQWSKLYDNSELKCRLSDKYAVREWIEEKIGDKYLIPLIGAYDCFDEIDFDKLPDKFAMKCNHGSGWNIIVKDKKSFDVKAARKKINRWMNTDFSFHSAFQLQYHFMKRKIVIEEYMENFEGLDDYKFMCFDGKPVYVWKDKGRYGKQHYRNVYDLDWNRLDLDYEYPRSEDIDERPQCYDEMLNIATTLSQGFSHVRVDLYEVDGKIYFGEMTFTSGNGLDRFKPSYWEEEFGRHWVLGEKKPIPDLRGK